MVRDAACPERSVDRIWSSARIRSCITDSRSACGAGGPVMCLLTTMPGLLAASPARPQRQPQQKLKGRPSPYPPSVQVVIHYSTSSASHRTAIAKIPPPLGELPFTFHPPDCRAGQATDPGDIAGGLLRKTQAVLERGDGVGGLSASRHRGESAERRRKHVSQREARNTLNSRVDIPEPLPRFGCAELNIRRGSSSVALDRRGRSWLSAGVRRKNVRASQVGAR